MAEFKKKKKERSSKEIFAGKVPPQNIDAEMSLLGAVLIDEEALSDVTEFVTTRDFYDKRHAAVYAAMLRLFERHKPVDLLKKDELEMVGGSAYLSELTNYVPTAAHAAAYAEMVSQKAIRRRLIKASSEISELGFDEEYDVQELLGKAEQELFSVSDQSLKQDLTSIETILTDSFDRMEELHRNKGALRGVRTGYRDLDGMTAGLQRSNLAYNVATANKQSVLFFSLEMSKEQLVDRMLADASGVDAWNIRTGNLSDEDFSKLSEAMGEMAEAPIFIDDKPGLSVLEMRTKARRAAHDAPLGLIIVDYLQLMVPTNARASDSMVQQVTEISRSLKGMARELNVPVLALSQLSRAVEQRDGHRPKLSDLRDSGSIEQDADLVMFIHREDKIKDRDKLNPEQINTAQLIIAKHRNGPTGEIDFKINPDSLKFLELDRIHGDLGQVDPVGENYL